MVVVVVAPSFQHEARVRDGAEERLVQKLVPQPRVEALGEGVLRRFPGLDVAPLDGPLVSPNEDPPSPDRWRGILPLWPISLHLELTSDV